MSEHFHWDLILDIVILFYVKHDLKSSHWIFVPRVFTRHPKTFESSLLSGFSWNRLVLWGQILVQGCVHDIWSYVNSKFRRHDWLVKNEAHSLTSSLFLSITENDASELCVSQSVAILIKLRCDNKTQQIFAFLYIFTMLGLVGTLSNFEMCDYRLIHG